MGKNDIKDSCIHECDDIQTFTNIFTVDVSRMSQLLHQPVEPTLIYYINCTLLRGTIVSHLDVTSVGGQVDRVKSVHLAARQVVKGDHQILHATAITRY